MRIKLKLRSKMLLSVLVVVTIIFMISFRTQTVKIERVTLNNAYSYIDATAREKANLIRSNMEHEFGLAKSLSQSFMDYHTMSMEDLFSETKRAIHGVATNNQTTLAVWACWELQAVDKKWNKPYGRHRFTYFRINNELNYIEEMLNLDGDASNSLYTNLKSTKKECLADPYWEMYKGTSTRVLETSICIPISHNDIFVGVFGFDFALARYQPYIEDIKPYEGSYAMLVSQNGTVVAHTEKNLIGSRVDSLIQLNDSNIHIINNIHDGKSFSTLLIDSLGNENYATFSAINISQTNNPWSLIIVSPKKNFIIEAQKAAKRSQMLVLIGLIVLAIVIGLLMYGITRPLTNASKVLGILAKGQIDIKNKLHITSGDEVEDIGNSINSLIDSLDLTAKFAHEIGRGNLKTPFKKLSDNDVLGESLLEMRKSLERSKELDEKRKIEEEKERWANEGIAKFAEILRNNTNNMEEFAYAVINNIVNYIDANIGGLFLLNTDNPKEKFFELKGCFAYENRKHEQKRIEIGEGLIGRCAKEGETILMTELPENYIKIATGLGFDDPKCLLLVPMKLNDEVFGVIELASFDIIETYKIKFIEKIGESIASTISNVKINIRTAQLLEESRIKSEELSTQEEEMRQNMEELQATQEEAARKTAEMESLISALNTSSYVVEYDLTGTVLSVNQAYLTLTRQSESNLIGTHHADNIEFTPEQKLNYQKFWIDLQNGIVRKETNKVLIENNEYTFIETYSPIYDENHQVKKILKIAHNITDFLGDKEGKNSKK